MRLYSIFSAILIIAVLKFMQEKQFRQVAFTVESSEFEVCVLRVNDCFERIFFFCFLHVRVCESKEDLSKVQILNK